MKNKILSLGSLCSIILFLNTACSQLNSSRQNVIIEGSGTFSMENDLIIYDDPGRRSENTYIRIKGVINVTPTKESLKAVHNSNRFARIEVNSINNKKFNIPVSGNLQLENDSTITFDIKLTKFEIERSQLKELPATMEISGNYIYYGDTTKYPLHITAEIDANKTNIYTRLINGDLEAELGLKIDFSIIKGLVLNQYDCFKSQIKIDLSKFTSVETLFIRGYIIDQPFPEEIYKLKKIKYLTFDVTNVNPDGTWKNASDCKFYLPSKVFEFPELKSLTFNHTVALNIPDFPYNSSLERFEVFSHCQVDSIPSTITRLKNLRNLSFYLGSIQTPLPDNLNLLNSLDTLIINMPDAYLPKNFGPWNQLKYLKLLQTNNSKLDLSVFEERKKLNEVELKNTFSKVKYFVLDGKKY
jgi:hypothetical protein